MRGRVAANVGTTIDTGMEIAEYTATNHPAVWGVMKQLGANQSGWSFGSGSGSVTSRYAPARRFLVRASASAFCPSPFTVAELRHVYEIVWGIELDPRNFHRKVTGTPGFLAPPGTTTIRDGGRPAQLYRRGEVTSLHPPLMRPSASP